ncbi:MAG: glycosyltransferase family 4 protein [Candidatus Binataceae bacterium]|jgi:glycosyltransferase involved in cell wall biosynthesis
MRPYRLAYLVSHPIQYQAPLLRYIAAEPSIDLTVFFLSDLSLRSYQDSGFGVSVQWDVPLLGGYKHVFLPSLWKRDSIGFWRPFAYGLRRHLKRGAFDALWLHGYANQANLRALALAKAIGLKVLLRGESHLNSSGGSAAKLAIKHVLIRGLFGLIDGFLAIGTLNREYYLSFGVPDERIFLMPYAVDNSFFQARVAEAESGRGMLRAELGLAEDRPIILYAAKFEKRKRASDLLEAYIRLSPDGVREPRPYLLFVGDGEERMPLESRVKQLGWSSVKFLGFVNQNHLPRYYDLCDIFVLPSELEPWGLAVNEVMNAGKAVIVSDHVGARADLVKDGDNGFVVPVGDVASLAERLRLLSERPETAASMGWRSRERIAAWNFDADLRGLNQALSAVVDGGAA